MRYILGVVFVFLSLMIGCSTRQEYRPLANLAEPSSEGVNINTASTSEIEKLPHIGRKTAEAIVAFREENGPFRRVETLLLIRGISEERFAALRPYLRTE